MNTNSTNTPKEINRIPRPKGATLLAKGQETTLLRDRIISAYLQGTFPFGGVHLSMYEFAELYNIPIQTVQRRIKDGLADNMLDDTDLAKTLEEERLKAFSQVLYRIGVSDHDIEKLTSHLGRAIYSSSRVSPDLISELNSAIGNKIKLSETQLKTIVLMNQAMTALLQQPKALTEESLSRDEILATISKAGVNIEDLKKHLKDTPDLSPIGLEAKRSAKSLNKEASHEYQKLTEVKKIPIQGTVVAHPR